MAFEMDAKTTPHIYSDGMQDNIGVGGLARAWTAREHLAAMAMQGLCAGMDYEHRRDIHAHASGALGDDASGTARIAFAIAGAMIDHAEREEPK